MSQAEANTAVSRILLGLTTVFLVVFIYDGVIRRALGPVVHLPPIANGLTALTLALMMFSLSHSLYTIGLRHTAIFFVSCAAISWAFEEVGVRTGLIFGHYHYSDILGAKLGHVPLLIPLAWYMMIYPSYVLANLIVDRRPTGSRGRTLRVAWLALVSASIMTAWDLILDPVFSGPRARVWVWEQGGAYFGVPIRNYAGWMVTTTTVFLTYRLYERWSIPREVDPLPNVVTVLPVIAYAAMFVSNVISKSAPTALWPVGLAAMGGPIFAALVRLRVAPREQPAPFPT